MNVLVFPGGSSIGLEIQQSLSQCKGITLHSAGTNVSNHAPYVFAQHHIMPSIHEENWLEHLNRLIREYDIDYIFPAYDDVIVALAENAFRIDARIVTSPLKTCLVTRSKSSTYRFFADILPVPRIFNSPNDIDRYPVFVKPDRGQGSEDAHYVRNREELFHILDGRHEHIIMEYLPGAEYTIDCFSDRERGLLFCGGRIRLRTRAGIAMDSQVVDDPSFRNFAEAINSKLEFYGAWFFQLKKDVNGKYKLLEIAPRIAGTMALHRVLGVNFALLSLYEQERTPVEILVNEVKVEIDRALVNRYRHNVRFHSVYVDLDDTLISKQGVNPKLISFLYQCVNHEQRLILLTRRSDLLEETLRKYKLVGLFDKIVSIRPSEEKADQIHDRDAIFIDDSFRERKKVSERVGILTFDCSMIEMLIDERV